MFVMKGVKVISSKILSSLCSQNGYLYSIKKITRSSADVFLHRKFLVLIIRSVFVPSFL